MGAPEAIILMGIQGAGKTTFYKERFFDTHVRISLDMLRTRNREKLLLEACLQAKQSFVVDNTNVLASDRARYLAPAQKAHFKVVGYFFPIELPVALRRNAGRPGKKAIPAPAVVGTFKKLEPPSLQEGFHELHWVSANG